MHGDERGDFMGDDRVEGLIDAALRSYAEPGEMPAARVVVARVLERARVLDEKRGRFLRWAVAVPLTACLLVALVAAWVMQAHRAPEIAWVAKAPGVVSGDNDAGAKAHSHSMAVAARLKSCPDTKSCARVGESVSLETASGDEFGAERALPKLEVFPTPRPLTAQEQALVVFATETPPKVQLQVVEAERHVGDPIVIAALKIRSLDDEAGNRE